MNVTQKLVVKEFTKVEKYITSDVNIDFVVNDSGVLNLYLIFIGNDVFNIKIIGDIKGNAEVNIICADYNNNNVYVNSEVALNGHFAKYNWILSSLATKSIEKTFDIKVVHNYPNTYGEIKNFGVAKDESKLVLNGSNYIIKGSKFSVTRQENRALIFDEKVVVKTLPLLKIDENEVKASHSATIGKLNDEHMYYMQTRGLTSENAKQLITYGYLRPVANMISDPLIKGKIEKRLEEVFNDK